MTAQPPNPTTGPLPVVVRVEVEFELISRKLILTLRRVDAEIIDRAAARAGCSVNVWLRGLVEARLADERALEFEQARVAAALDLNPRPRR